MAALIERLEGLVARAVVAMPAGMVRRLAGRPIVVEGQALDPHVQLALKLERLVGGFEPKPAEEVRAMRRADARVFRGRTIEVGRVSDLRIPGPAGLIGARLYAPAGVAEPAPLIVYLHGGGHVVGDLDTHDQPCRFLTSRVPALVLSVDYRLGPEHPFPAAVEDSIAAFEWANAEAERLGADPSRIAIAGDSAGGNLATVVAQLAARGDGPAPCFQLLIYPVADYSFNRPSYATYAEDFFLTKVEMDWYRDNYFANPDDRTDPRASPILAGDLSDLAPAHVVTAGFDPLRDEGEDYAAAMREAGVEVTLKRETDLVHGFVNAVGLGGRSLEAMEEIAAAARHGLRATALR